MKCISVFFLCAAAMLAADFTTGQAARLVIGQTTFTSQDPNSSDTIVGGVSGLAYAADTLFVADSNRVGAAPSNHRVLLFQNLSGQLPSPTAQLSFDRKCPVCLGQATVVIGQPDFTTTTENLTASQNSLRLPTAVASDGIHVVVADTNHNRVLIWNRIPATNDAPADVVVGQPDFVSSSTLTGSPTAKSMRGPQGVWIQNGKLYVADTQNNRVLIYNQIPTTNGAAADVVLGQPNFTTAIQPDLAQQTTSAAANNLLNPVSATSDGLHLFVADLGYNRVLIWNTIPTTNQAPADVVIGQPDMNSSVANNAFSGTAATSSTDANGNTTTTTTQETPVLCTVSNGADANNQPTYPNSCNATLSFPRFVLAAANRLFIADGGNDRVLVFKQIPTQNAPSADYIIGQIGGTVNQASDAADSLRTPMSLAWDGTNLYVSDAYNRRITAYSVGANSVPYQGVVNAASLAIFASGNVTIGGTIQAGDVVSINIGGTSTTDSSGKPTATGGATYTYTVKAADTFTDVIGGQTVNDVIAGLVAAITSSNSGAGDPNVLVTSDTTLEELILTARKSGSDGNNITYSTWATPPSSKSTALITSTGAASTLSGGGDAAKVAAGSVVSIFGANLSFGSDSADMTQNQLPDHLAGTEVYVNGIRAPLFSVSPTQINAQIPWEVSDTTSVNAFVRSVGSDGSVVVTTPVAVTIVPQNPGIYAQQGTDPLVGLVFHGSSSATGLISVDGTAGASDVVTITIEDRTYTYTVQSGDTLDSIRDVLVGLINQDPKVTASASGVFDRILLTARVQGPEGNRITYGASANDSAQVVMTALGSSLCCASVAGTPVTHDNPAAPGEVVFVTATGLGLPVITDADRDLIQTGAKWPQGGPNTQPVNFVSALAGGSTADVLSATFMPGTVGNFLVFLHLNSSLTNNAYTTLTIAQDVYVSNVVTFAVAGSQ
jgi:sugar lactone lactonase YvrE